MAGYVGITGRARRIVGAYIGVNDVARKCFKGYVGINNIAYQFILNTAAEMFGNGSDGDITYNTSRMLTVNDQERNMVRINAKNLTINSNVTVTMPRCNGAIIMCTGDLTIHGTLTADKCSPYTNQQEQAALAETHVAVLPDEAKCGDGSSATLGSYDYPIPDTHQLVGASGTGGVGTKIFGGWGGGSGGYIGIDQNLSPLSGGSVTDGVSGENRGANSGKGGDFTYGYTNRKGGTTPGSSGAAWLTDYDDVAETTLRDYDSGLSGDAFGGGMIILAVAGTVTIDGHVYARGGDGADSMMLKTVGEYATTYAGSGAGGAGGGGMIVFITNDDSQYNVPAASVSVAGGKGGYGWGSSYGVDDAEDGGAGFTHHYTLSDLFI